MTTDQDRAEFEDGAWYWVEKEGWHDEPPKIAPAMYRADCDAWYSWGFSGISTRYLKVLEPCVRYEQAARRAPVVPEGDVVITTNDFGHIVAVTRQDEDGVALSVLAMSEPIFTQKVADAIAILSAAPKTEE